MILIRADGNAEIGAGHLMRCLTVADELQKHMDSRGILFVCADGRSAELARSRGYEAFVLDSDPREMEAELSAWPGIPVRDKETDVIIDSYFVTERYLRKIREYGRVTLLDDMGEERFPVDRIVNYNVFADRERYESLYQGSGTELILGSAYVPVRPQFRERAYKVRERVEDILITAGGGDVDNIAGKILERVRKEAQTAMAGGNGITHEMLNYHLVIGGFNPHFEEMKALERQQPDVHIYHNVHDMAELMCCCDLAVTAGGSTVYELAALGVPFICFSYAENQENMTEYLRREEIGFSAGAYHRDPEAVLERIAEQAGTLMKDRKKRNGCYLMERRMVDGAGAERLARLLARFPDKTAGDLAGCDEA
ncbi:MAG: UDP-2,4-diacetamido-2,4,6-trideoxy-beta-L-altropyranose hydrolase [Eubacterium sp.]|nr:UDP-2,4-diacetamido-2,4,6-trideoxy-beta-L-altropyranose hydrolase [Eubacterium sp.]